MNCRDTCSRSIKAIVLAAYTANLASFLTNADYGLKPSSFSECVSLGPSHCRICGNAYIFTLDSIILKSYPGYVYFTTDRNGKTLFTTSDVARAVHDGTCDAGLVSSFELLRQPLGWYGCSVTMIESVVVSLPYAMPISTRYASSMSYYMLKFVQNGRWDALETSWLPENFDEDYQPSSPSQSCGTMFYDSTASSDSEQLSVTQFSGALLVLLFALVAGTLVATFEKKREKMQNRLSNLTEEAVEEVTDETNVTDVTDINRQVNPFHGSEQLRSLESKIIIGELQTLRAEVAAIHRTVTSNPLPGEKAPDVVDRTQENNTRGGERDEPPHDGGSSGGGELQRPAESADGNLNQDQKDESDDEGKDEGKDEAGEDADGNEEGSSSQPSWMSFEMPTISSGAVPSNIEEEAH